MATTKITIEVEEVKLYSCACGKITPEQVHEARTRRMTGRMNMDATDSTYVPGCTQAPEGWDRYKLPGGGSIDVCPACMPIVRERMRAAATAPKIEHSVFLVALANRLEEQLPEKHRSTCDAEWRGISWQACALCAEDRKAILVLRECAQRLQ